MDDCRIRESLISLSLLPLSSACCDDMDRVRERIVGTDGVLLSSPSSKSSETKKTEPHQQSPSFQTPLSTSQNNKTMNSLQNNTNNNSTNTPTRHPMRSPFQSPLFGEEAVEDLNLLSLSSCRKVSVVVRIALAPGESLFSENDDDNNDSDNRLCVFPLIQHNEQLDLMTAFASACEDSPKDLVVINPTAFGTLIPSNVTMETAQLVQTVAGSTTEDWARRFSCHQVLWPTQTQRQTPLQVDSTSSPLSPLARAIANDVTRPGSISHRTVLSMGANGHEQYTMSELNQQQATSLPISVLFGLVAQSSVAQVLALPDVNGQCDPEEEERIILTYYGLVGLVAHKIVSQHPRLTVTLSLLEVNQQDLFDLLAVKPFDPKNKVQLRHKSSSKSRPSQLIGLSDVPISDAKQLGRTIRRGLAAAGHKKRSQAAGHVVATIKVWNQGQNNSMEHANSRCTVAQFLQVAHVPNQQSTDATLSHPGPASPSTPATIRRNAFVRQSITALGSVLRGMLLKQAGNDTMVSFRESILTQVLQRSMDHLDARMVVLANVSPFAGKYEETLTTLRYVSRLLYPPGHTHLFQSPFEGTRSNNKNDSSNHSMNDIASEDSSSAGMIHLEQYADRKDLLQNLLSDPRQRLAKLLKQPKRRLEEELDEDDDASTEPTTMDAYVPTNYDYTEEQNHPASELPTPLIRNGVVERFATFTNDQSTTLTTGHVQRFAVDTTFSLDALEQGKQTYAYEEPSPLTTDTGFTFNNMSLSRFEEMPQVFDKDEHDVLGQNPLMHSESQQSTEKGVDNAVLLGWGDTQGRGGMHHRQSDLDIMRDLSYELFENGREKAPPEPSFIKAMDDLEHELNEKTRFTEAVENGAEDLQHERQSLLLDTLDQKAPQFTPVKTMAEVILEQTKSEAHRRVEHDGSRELSTSEQAQRMARCPQIQLEGGMLPEDEGFYRLSEPLEESVAIYEQRIARLIAERDAALEAMRRAQARLKEETERFQIEMERRQDDIDALEAAVEHAKQQLNESIKELLMARDVAEKELKATEEEWNQERARHASEVQRKEEMIRNLKKSLDHNKEQAKLSQDESLQGLTEERDRAVTDLRSTELDLKRLQSDLDFRDDELERVKVLLVEVRAKAEQSEEESNCLEQDRDRVVQEARLADETLIIQQKRFQQETERHREELAKLEDGVRLTKASLDHAQDQLSVEKQKAQEERQSEVERYQQELDRRVHEIEDLKNTVELLKAQMRMSYDEAVASLAQERDRAIKESKSTQSDMQFELGKFQHVIDRKELVIRELEAQLEKTTSQFKHVQEEVVVKLSDERDKEKADVRRLQNDLQLLTDQHKREHDASRQEIMDIEMEMERLRLSFKKTQDTVIADLTADRDAAVIQARRAEHELQLTLDRHQREAGRHEQNLKLLEESMERMKEQMRRSEDQSITEISNERDKVERELQMVKREMEVEIERFHNELDRKELDMRETRNLADKLATELEQVRTEDIGLLTSERDLAIQEADDLRDQIRRMSEGTKQDLCDRDSRVRQLEEALVDSKLQLEKLQAETESAQLSELDHVKQQAIDDRQAFEENFRDYKDLVMRQETEINKLEADLAATANTVKQAQSDRQIDRDTTKIAVEKLLEEERECHIHELRRKDDEIRHVNDALKVMKARLEQENTETVRALIEERDRAEKEARQAKQELVLEAERRERDSLFHEEKLQLLQANIGRTKHQLRQSHDEVFAELVAERDRAEKHAQGYKHELEFESERRKNDVSRLEEELQELQESLTALKTREDVIKEENARLEEAAQQSLKQKQLSDREAENAKNELTRCNQKIRGLHDSHDKSQLKLNDRIENLVAERDSAFEEIQKQRNDRELEETRHRLLIEIKETDYEQLKESTTKMMHELQMSKEEAVAEMLSELERSEKESAKVILEYQQSVERYQRELEQKNDELLELQACLEGTSQQSKKAHDNAMHEILAERERAENKVSDARSLLAQERELWEKESKLRDQEINDLQADLAKSKLDRAEIVKIAEEAIATQAELESRVAELEDDITERVANSIPKSIYEELEAVNTDLSTRVDEQDAEVRGLVHDLDDVRQRVAELQAQLHSVMAEKDFSVSRNNELEREMSILLEKVGREDSVGSQAQVLLEENTRLALELQQLRKTSAANEAAKQQESAYREDLTMRFKKECERLQSDLLSLVESHKNESFLRNQELSSIEEELDASRKRLKEAESRFIQSQNDLQHERETKSSMSSELEHTRKELALRVADVKDLSTGLKAVLVEKEQAEETILSLKEALATFQDETRAKVQKVIDQRSEAAFILEKSLSENKALGSVNEMLQSSLDDLQNNTLAGIMQRLGETQDELGRLRSDYQVVAKENLKLRDSIGALETEARRLDRSYKEEPDNKLAARRRPLSLGREDEQTAKLLERVLQQNEQLTKTQRKIERERQIENERHAERDPLSYSTPSTKKYDKSVDREDMGMEISAYYSDFQARADEIAAYIALSAKKAVERKDYELSHLKRQLTVASEDEKHAEIIKLKRRIEALEHQLNERTEERENSFHMEDKDSEIELLKLRVRSLERKLGDDVSVPRSSHRELKDWY